MAKLYLMEKLEQIIMDVIDNFKVTFENLLIAFETAQKYRDLDGFEDLSEGVTNKIKTLVVSMPHSNLHQFYDDNLDTHPDLIRALIRLLAVPDCDNCLHPEANCKNGHPISVLPHVGMMFKLLNTTHIVVKVNATEAKTSAGKEIYNVHVGYDLSVLDRCTDVWKFPKAFGDQSRYFCTGGKDCSNCQNRLELCQDGRQFDRLKGLPHVGMRLRIENKNFYVVQAVIPTNEEDEDGEKITNIEVMCSGDNHNGLRTFQYPLNLLSDLANSQYHCREGRMCFNCSEPLNLCKHGTRINTVPHQRLRFSISRGRVITRVDSVTPLDISTPGREVYRVMCRSFGDTGTYQINKEYPNTFFEECFYYCNI